MSSRAARHLRAVPSANSAAAAREFAVRFTAATGLAVWLQQTPSNSFGWVGPGTLQFGDEGLQVSARRRTLLGLRRTRRLIHASEVRAVYREGNAVAIDVRTIGRRHYFRFWAHSAADAAAIVERLPARRAIEFDAPLRGPAVRRTRRPTPWWLLLPLAATLIALAWFGRAYLPGSTALQVPRAHTAHAAVSVPGGGAAHAATEDDVLRARADLRKFGERFDALQAQFSMAFMALQGGALSQQQFIDGLNQWLLPQWDTLAGQLRSNAPELGVMQARAREHLNGSVESWRRALGWYVRGLKDHDFREVDSAFRCLRNAESHQEQARRLLRELQSEPPPGVARAEPAAH